MWGILMKSKADALENYLLEKRKPMATEDLRSGLEETQRAYIAREADLVQEIADRQAELADVRRANQAVFLALMELKVDPAALEAEFTDLFSPKPDVIVAPRETTGPNMDKLAKELTQSTSR